MGRGKQAKPERLAEKLSAIRTQLGLSQNGIVRQLGLQDDLTREEWSAFERSIRMPPWWVLLPLARKVNVSLETLVDDALNLPSHLYAEHTKKWILNSVAHRACRHSIDTRTSPES
jgi:transcriptional regulator with XRE-family HTH domain